MRSIQRGITTTFVIIIILASAVTVTAAYFNFYTDQNKKLSAINSFEDCAKHYPVMESYPEQCNTPDGKHFTRELSDEEKQKLVPPSLKPSPLAISDSSKNCIENPKIDPLIIGFIKDPEQVAQTYNISIKDSKISVEVITLAEGGLSGYEFIETEIPFGKSTIGRIKLEDICKLVDVPVVTYIKFPNRPIPQ